MIKLLSRLMGSEQSEEISTEVLVEEIEDAEASQVSGGFLFWFWD